MSIEYFGKPLVSAKWRTATIVMVGILVTIIALNI